MNGGQGPYSPQLTKTSARSAASTSPSPSKSAGHGNTIENEPLLTS